VSFQSYSWEIPAGGDLNGSDPIGTAHRELREETGFSAGRMAQILDMELSNSITDERALVYLATGLEALDAVDTGEIRQALSVAAILKLGRMRAAGQLEGL